MHSFFNNQCSIEQNFRRLDLIFKNPNLPRTNTCNNIQNVLDCYTNVTFLEEFLNVYSYFWY